MFAPQRLPPNRIKPGLLRKFPAFESLGPDQIISLAYELEILKAEAGDEILPAGAELEDLLYLVQGKVVLEAPSGEKRVIDAASHEAREPLVRIRPALFSVRALSPCRYFFIEEELLTGLVSMAPRAPEPSSDQSIAEAAYQHPMYLDFMRDLKANQVTLPSLPNIAMSIREAIRYGRDSANQLAIIINTDAAMAAKIIKVSNSPIYRGLNPILNCRDAIIRLGIDATRELVTCYSIRDIFHTYVGPVRERMKALWEHSLDVAAISRVLAGMSRDYHPETAMLAGLLYSIGEIPLLGYAENYFDDDTDAAALQQLMDTLRGEVGALLLRQWHMDELLVNATEFGSDWQYDNDAPGDYANLIIVARRHSYIGRTPPMELPALDAIPAFGHLGIAQLTPGTSFQVMAEASKAIEAARTVLAG